MRILTKLRSDIKQTFLVCWFSLKLFLVVYLSECLMLPSHYKKRVIASDKVFPSSSREQALRYIWVGFYKLRIGPELKIILFI